MQEKISSTSNFVGSQRGFIFLTAFLLFPDPDASLLPTVALKMNEVF
jgi:hypothetical protein